MVEVGDGGKGGWGPQNEASSKAIHTAPAASAATAPTTAATAAALQTYAVERLARVELEAADVRLEAAVVAHEQVGLGLDGRHVRLGLRHGRDGYGRRESRAVTGEARGEERRRRRGRGREREKVGGRKAGGERDAVSSLSGVLSDSASSAAMDSRRQAAPRCALARNTACLLARDVRRGLGRKEGGRTDDAVLSTSAGQLAARLTPSSLWNSSIR